MAYRTEKTPSGVDIVIDNFEAGIADSPEEGIADMRNMNIISVPKESAVGFATSAMNVPPTVTAVSVTGDAGTDILTVSSTTGWYNGMAVVFNSLTGGTGLSTGVVYYVFSLSGNTFKVGTYLTSSSIVNFTTNVTAGTLSSYTLNFASATVNGFPTNPVKYTVDPTLGTFFIDSSNKVWYINTSTAGSNLADNSIIYLGNILTPTGQGGGISILGRYLMVFSGTQIDYALMASFFSTAPGTVWQYNWIGGSPDSTAFRDCISATDDAIYFTNGSAVGSILHNPGSSAFNPGTPATYTFNSTALALPQTETATCLGQLGTFLLVGGVKNFVYPWNRTATSYNYPIILAESRTSQIITTNSNAYLFTGNRGRIYVTNGSNVELYKKIPDSLSGTVDPYYTWTSAQYWKNQLYCGFTTQSNAAISIETTGGVWAIDTQTEALRLTNRLSYGAYTGSTVFISPNVTAAPAGGGFFVAWSNNGTYGVDRTSSSPYTNFEAYLDSDLIPVGTFLDVATFEQVEFKLSRPLVTGESVRLSWRGNLTDSFTPIGTTSTAGLLSEYYPVNFQKTQWLQIRGETSSTASSPSYVTLREIRLR